MSRVNLDGSGYEELVGGSSGKQAVDYHWRLVIKILYLNFNNYIMFMIAIICTIIIIIYIRIFLRKRDINLKVLMMMDHHKNDNFHKLNVHCVSK